jgi:hypothetical protein
MSIERKLIGMLNKNFYREFNKKPVKEYNLEAIYGGILLALVITAFSILSYGFWDALFEIIGGR